MSTKTNTTTDTAAPPKMVAFVGKYAATVAGDDRHVVVLTAGQAYAQFARAQSSGTLNPSAKEPEEGFSFCLPAEPPNAEGPRQLVRVLPIDDWMLTMMGGPASATPATLMRVLERLQAV